MTFCTKCGKQLNDGAKFCTSCGNVISDAQPAVQPAQKTASPYAVNSTTPIGQGAASKAFKNLPIIFTTFWKIFRIPVISERLSEQRREPE